MNKTHKWTKHTDEQNTQMNKTHRWTKPGFNPEAIAQCYSGKISKDQMLNSRGSYILFQKYYRNRRDIEMILGYA